MATVDCGKPGCGARPLSLSSAASSFDADPSPPSSGSGFALRIVGGSESEAETWPSVAALFRDGEFACGATVIQEWWVLTAAHCVHDFQKNQIFLQVTKG